MSDTPLNWGAAWRIARRDLNARFAGLRLLLVCLFLGVGALAAIGTLTSAITGEIEDRGREILGGDIQVSVWQRDLEPDERAALAELGEVSGGYRLQAMASTREQAAPVGLKAVADNWPLVGTLVLEDGRSVGAPAAGEAWIASGVADRLAVQTGDSFGIGGKQLRVGGIIATEPDALSEGFTLGPTVIVAEAFPDKAGLTAPGALYRSRTRVAFDTPRDREAVEEALDERFPSAGLDIDTADRASPGTERFVGRMGEFLILVGLAALVIAGIGIAGGVSSYLDARRQSIATLKILGATSADIARIYALQIGAAALVGSLTGLVAGLSITPLLTTALGEVLPVSTGFVFDGWALLRATAFGLLVALVFAAPPLLAARGVPAMALMRDRAGRNMGAHRRESLRWVGGGLAGLIALSLIGAENLLLNAGFLAGAAAILGLLWALGRGIRAVAARLPAPRRPLLRVALANLHRPGAPTGRLVTALGFGLSAFVMLAGIESAITNNIDRTVPAEAPEYFVLDIPQDGAKQFEQLVRASYPSAEIRTIPTMRGRVLAYGDPADPVRVDELEELPEGAWALRGERGLTYAPILPEGNVLTEGDWWPADYDGEPLVSVDEEFARAIDLKIGDTLTIGVLGAERTARVANVRRIDWESMGFNYVLVFSPNTLADTPHNLAATVDLPNGVESGALLRQLVSAFPSSSVVETGDILTRARDILEQVNIAVLAAASVTVLAGLAVLLGAIAAARASRIYDIVVLRVLGASQRQLLLLQLGEYALLAAILSVVGLVLGGGVAWAIVTQLFEFDWLPDWGLMLGVTLAGAVLVTLFALAGSINLLRARPARSLRAL